MKRSFLLHTAALFGFQTALLAQAPSLPKIVTSDSSQKAEAAKKAAANAEVAAKASKASKASESAKSAEKASSAQKSADKAQVAQDAAEKAESAQKSASKAESSQKAAEKAASAQKAAEKAVSVQKTAEKATGAQQAADKANTAQKAAEKASAAQKIAEKANSAQKTADKANSAQQAAEKANSAQRASEKASVAQQAAEKAASAQKTAEKADSATRSVSKVESAQKAAEKATVSQKVAEKASQAEKSISKAETADKAARNATAASQAAEKNTSSQQASTKAEEALKAAQKAQVALPQQKSIPTPKVVSQQTGNQIAKSSPPLTGPTIKAPAPEIKSSSPEKKSAAAPSNTPPPSGAQKSAKSTSPITKAGRGGGKDTSKDTGASTSSVAAARVEMKTAVTELAKDSLSSIGIKDGSSQKLADRFAEGDPDAQKTVHIVADSAAAFQLVGVNENKAQAILNEIADRGLTDSSNGGTADNLVGDLIIEELTGRRAPKNSLQGEVARSLIDAKAALILTAIEEDSPEGSALINQIVDQGLHGARAKKLIDATVQPVIDAAVAEQTATVVPGSTDTGTPGQGPVAGRPDPGQIERGADDIKTPVQVEEGAGNAPTGADAGTVPAAPVVDAQPAPAAEAPAPVVETPATVTQPGPAPVDTAQAPASTNNPGTDPNNRDIANPSFGTDTTTENTVTIQEDGQRLIFTERDSSGAVVSTTIIIDMGDGRESVIVKDGTGKVTDAYVQNAPQETVVSTQRTNDGSDNTQTDTQSDTQTDTNTPAEDDSGDDADAEATPTPPPEEESGKEEEPVEEAAEQETASNSTPNPMDDGGRNPAELAIRTEGRLGGEQARSQQRALDLAASGGGAAGPTDKDTAPVLLTVEEQNNFRRLYQQKTGGGVTDPSPLEDSGIAVTLRDLKELHLKGNGGAKGPVDNTPPPAAPLNPQSPIGGTVPGVLPGGTRVPTTQIQKIEVDSSVQQGIKADVRSVK